LALLPGAALADQGCGAVWFRLVPDAMGVPVHGEVSETADGWCEVRDASLGGGHDFGAVFRAELIRWRAPGLVRFLQALRVSVAPPAPPPASFDLEFEGARMGIVTGEPGYDWIVDTQTVPTRFRGDLAVVWDPSRAELDARLDLDFQGDNAIWIEATVDQTDLSSIAALQGTLGRAGLTRLWGEVTTQGLFEGFALPALAPVLLDGTADPDLVVEANRILAAQAIRDLPPAIFSNPTKADLLELLAELPNPSGILTFEVGAEEGPGLGLPRFSRFLISGLPDSPEGLWAALDGITVTADWTPLPRPD
jgi:hypothetical protein